MSYRGGGFRTIRYQESFNRLDQPPFLGLNWNMEQTPASNVAGVTVDGNVNVGGGIAAFGATGGVYQMIWTPQYVNRQLIKNLSQTRVQYAQIKARSLVGVNCSIGPTVLKAEPNSAGCYILILQGNGTLQLFRNVDASAVILNAAVGVWAINDVLRIEATVTPSATTIRCYKNGVLQSTDIDNTGARISFGMYGICYFSSVGASQIGFSDFDGGLN